MAYLLEVIRFVHNATYLLHLIRHGILIIIQFFFQLAVRFLLVRTWDLTALDLRHGVPMLKLHNRMHLTWIPHLQHS